MSDRYILNGKTPVPEPDLMKWGSWLETNRRHVADNYYYIMRGNRVSVVRVSTVFLGLDHNFFRQGPPLLFETMIFGGPLDEFQERCSTWQQAETQHEMACLQFLDRIMHSYRVVGSTVAATA